MQAAERAKNIPPYRVRWSPSTELDAPRLFGQEVGSCEVRASVLHLMVECRGDSLVWQARRGQTPAT